MVQELLSGDLEAVAQGLGIPMAGVPERQLKVIIGEAQEGFRKQFG